MSGEHKVVWSEGMFLRPQHFQQQERYLEALVRRRTVAVLELGWGFSALEVDEDALSLGRVVIRAASGVMPDGTPFHLPRDASGLLSLDLPATARDTVVCLAVPPADSGGDSVLFEEDAVSAARWLAVVDEARDANRPGAGGAEIQTGRMRFRLFPAAEVPTGWIGLGVVRVAELLASKAVLLDRDYIPPMLACKGHPVLDGFVREVAGLLSQRADALASRLTAGGRGGVSEVADFLLLKLVNHWLPPMMHLDSRDAVHPERLYSKLLRLVGELATFSSQRRASVYPCYRHDALKESFAPVMADLRRALSLVMEQTAIRVPLEERKYGIRMAVVPDRQLLRSASFVFAAHAGLPPDQLQAQFPAQVKVGPVEKIRDLVNLHLPGVRLKPLPIAPRELPYHAGYQYFELDSHHELWRELERSAGIAVHIAGEFPDLDLECWAIRR